MQEKDDAIRICNSALVRIEDLKNEIERIRKVLCMVDNASAKLKLTGKANGQKSEPDYTYRCRRCGKEMNDGEGKTFVVCSKCWDDQ